ncbi:MAG: cobalamin-dependent protein [Bdellovibrionales bacterium]|nr:cobalamin-dependent protein [Bdellovibrionales bacterium]
MDNPKVSKFHKLYLEAALNGDRLAASGVVDSAVECGIALEDIYTEVLCRAQRVLGERWIRGEINIAEEHLVSNITMEQLGRLRERIVPKHKNQNRIVLTTLPGDQHALGVRVVGDFFLMNGWSVEFLGLSTPTDDLLAFIRSREFDVVAISVSVDTLIPLLLDTGKRIKAAFPEIPIIAGGAALHGCTKEELFVDALVLSAKEAVQEAFRLIGSERVQLSLEDILSEVGASIRALRRSKSIQQKELGEAAGLDRAYISAIEKGKKNLTIGSLFKISRALDVRLQEILPRC